MSLSGIMRGGAWLALLTLLAWGFGGCATHHAARVNARTPNIWPMPNDSGKIVSGFGVRANPWGGNMRHHDGVDIAAPKGTPVYATADGEVVFSGTQRGYGNVILIDHGDGLESLYGHLLKRKTREGKFVRQGNEIGCVGKTGNATGYHLHYELRRDGKAIDPMPYLPKH